MPGYYPAFFIFRELQIERNYTMKALHYIMLTLVVFACTDSNEKKSADAPKSVVDVQKIKSEYAVDVAQMSYCFGQVIRNKAARQGLTEVVENQFINSFCQAITNPVQDLGKVNSVMNEIRQSQGRYPNAKLEMSKNMGLLMGSNEATNDFLQPLDVVNFAQGFKGMMINQNKLNLNCDSLFTSENGKYNEYIGKRFLEENRKNTELTVTESGLQYEVLEKGEGEKPNENSEVTVHYTGSLIDGKVFDSSVSRGKPISFNLQGVIPGWTEGLQLMSKGAKYKFFIPYELAYGSRSAGKIPAFSTLIFEVQLIEFK